MSELLTRDQQMSLLGAAEIPARERQSWQEHTERFGPFQPGLNGEQMLQILTDIELTGRGGAHFPVARKWRAVATGRATPVLVANGAESELASAKDAVLLQTSPHLVLDGMALAAATIGAPEAVLWLHNSAKASLACVQAALAERRSVKMREVTFRIACGPDHYLTGESSAVISALSGRQALPMFQRERAVVSGVDGRPTLVHNVETLARVALAGRTGAQDYPGGSLLTVVGSARVVVETMGETFEQVLRRAWAGGTPGAVLLGGYAGTWVSWDELAPLPAEVAALKERGLSLGAGVVIPLAGGSCGLATASGLAAYLADSSAAQCGPCYFGLPSLSDALKDLLAGRSDSLARIHRLVGQIEGRGACGHPDGVVNMVRSALRTFAADASAHERTGRCLDSGHRLTLPGMAPL